MTQYCGFIEVWKIGKEGEVDMHDTTIPIHRMEDSLTLTKKLLLETIAIFKIKLDGGYNKNKTQQHENIH